jgi:hypothetical protein
MNWLSIWREYKDLEMVKKFYLETLKVVDPFERVLH